MPRRFPNRWLMWLLPVIALRAFLPTGFMLDVGEHGIQIVMCSGAGPIRDLHQSPQSHTHHGDGHHSDHATDKVLCLYAVAGAACATPALAATVTPPPTAQEVVFSSDATRSAEPFLPDRIRGPPVA